MNSVLEKLTIHEVNECEDETEQSNEVEQEESNLIEEIDCYDYYDDDDDEEDEDYGDYSGYDEIIEEDRYRQTDRQIRRSDTITSVDNSTDYFKILNKQVFLGMVSMQYQPLHDMVISLYYLK